MPLFKFKNVKILFRRIANINLSLLEHSCHLDKKFHFSRSLLVCTLPSQPSRKKSLNGVEEILNGRLHTLSTTIPSPNQQNDPKNNTETIHNSSLTTQYKIHTLAIVALLEHNISFLRTRKPRPHLEKLICDKLSMLSF